MAQQFPGSAPSHSPFSTPAMLSGMATGFWSDGTNPGYSVPGAELLCCVCDAAAGVGVGFWDG
ncbi:MAG: hypothetical protein ABSA16_00525 [Thermoguttaceae bacterium]